MNIKFGVNKEGLLHARLFGITCSGKSNAALVFISRYIRALGTHVLILDWK